MKPFVHVDHVANTGPKMTKMFAFISRDSDGRENVIGLNLAGLGMTPAITGNPKTLEIFRAVVKANLAELQAKGQTIHLLQFTQPEEVSIDAEI